MASYDWFLRAINKINSDNPSLIHRTIYIADKEQGVLTAVVMDVCHGKIKYKVIIPGQPPIYADAAYSGKNIDWFINFEGALNKVEMFMKEECAEQ